MKKLCVLVGANFGSKQSYFDETKRLGKEIAKRNITLVYGGGRLGLMGVLADAVLENGGKVIGVITKKLYTLEAYPNLTDLKIVNSMQERKNMMLQLADALMALPGGLGTLEEVCEFWNASKLKIHTKPIGLLNIDNYFNKLMDFLDYSVQEKFLKLEHRSLIKISNDIHLLLDSMIKNDSLKQEKVI